MVSSWSHIENGFKIMWLVLLIDALLVEYRRYHGHVRQMAAPRMRMIRQDDIAFSPPLSLPLLAQMSDLEFYCFLHAAQMHGQMGRISH